MSFMQTCCVVSILLLLLTMFVKLCSICKQKRFSHRSIKIVSFCSLFLSLHGTKFFGGKSISNIYILFLVCYIQIYLIIKFIYTIYALVMKCKKKTTKRQFNCYYTLFNMFMLAGYVAVNSLAGLIDICSTGSRFTLVCGIVFSVMHTFLILAALISMVYLFIIHKNWRTKSL